MVNYEKSHFKNSNPTYEISLTHYMCLDFFFFEWIKEFKTVENLSRIGLAMNYMEKYIKKFQASLKLRS